MCFYRLSTEPWACLGIEISRRFRHAITGNCTRIYEIRASARTSDGRGSRQTKTESLEIKARGWGPTRPPGLVFLTRNFIRDQRQFEGYRARFSTGQVLWFLISSPSPQSMTRNRRIIVGHFLNQLKNVSHLEPEKSRRNEGLHPASAPHKTKKLPGPLSHPAPKATKRPSRTRHQWRSRASPLEPPEGV